MAKFRAPLLCLLLMALCHSMWGASALPMRSNCPVSDQELCVEASQSVKLTCCEPNPASPYSYPKHGCADLRSNPGFCGSCTNVCQTGDTCVKGKCVPVKVCKFACIEGFTCCNGECVNTEADNNNCGKCGVSCEPPKGQVGLLKFCYNGECVI